MHGTQKTSKDRESGRGHEITESQAQKKTPKGVFFIVGGAGGI